MSLVLAPGCRSECRGCAHRGWEPTESLAQKDAYLARVLSDWKDRLEPTRSVPPEQRWGYRRRVSLSAREQDGWRFGIWARDLFVPIEQCPIQSPQVNGVLQVLAGALPPNWPLAYYLQTGAQATLIVRQADLPAASWWTEPIGRALEELGLEGLWVHCNPSAGRRLLGKLAWQLWWGSPRSRDSQGLLYGPACFLQVLPELHRQALDLAQAFLQGGRLIDLYCGYGSMLARWQEAAVGVELSKESVECARVNAPAAQVLRGPCHQRLPQLNDWLATGRGPVSLYCNPPRSGLDPELVDWLVQVRPRRLAYLSCSPGTLARDLGRLATVGYQVVRLVGFDFFPQTHHVECLALCLWDG